MKNSDFYTNLDIWDQERGMMFLSMNGRKRYTDVAEVAESTLKSLLPKAFCNT